MHERKAEVVASEIITESSTPILVVLEISWCDMLPANRQPTGNEVLLKPGTH